jgi:lipopolysaccharide export system protein LptC
MSSRTEAIHRVPRGRSARLAARSRRAPYISGAFALIVLALIGIFLYQTGTFTSQPKPVMDAAVPADQVTVADSTITGLDSEQQPYAISAATAVQDKEKPNFITLDKVSGSTSRGDGEKILFQSEKGLYNSDVKTLDLDTDVVIRSAGRFTARMDKAHVIVEEKRLTSAVPVAVELSNGTINANGVEISNDGNNILFLNGVKAHFEKSSSKGDSTP